MRYGRRETGSDVWEEDRIKTGNDCEDRLAVVHTLVHTCTAVLFPLPLLPTRATVLPAGILRLKPLGECGELGVDRV